MKFLLPEVALYLPYAHAWNTAVVSGLMLLVASQNSKIGTKTEM